MSVTKRREKRGSLKERQIKLRSLVQDLLGSVDVVGSFFIHLVSMGLKPELELGTEGAEAEYVDPALEMMINPFLCACRSEIGAYLKIYKTVSLFLSPMGLTDKQRVSWRSDRQVSTLPHAIPLIPMDPKWLDTFGYLLYCFVCAQKRIFCATKCATEMAREG